MRANNLFSPSQHGFVAGRSCTTQLLVAMDYWTQSLNDRYPVDIIYLDFRKAFDSVPHKRLLIKLNAYGISGSLLDWIQNFLSGRKQRELSLMVAILFGPQFLVGFPKGRFLDPYSLYYMLMTFHQLLTVQYYYLLMMPRSINQLDVKRTTCDFNMILLHCMSGQELGYLILILASVTFCI